MASICLSQTNYQQQQHQQQFQLVNNNMLLLQQSQQQPCYMGKHQTIAPATGKVLGSSSLHNIHASANSMAGACLGPILPKKKYTYANMPYGEQLPSVARRNARERNRVKQVNNGFANLRQHLPQTVINALSHGGRGASKKLSKVDTLRIAVEYIRGLQDLLDDSRTTTLADENSNDGSNFGYSSVGSPSGEPHYQQYHSEASASPTPSYTDSDISIGGAAGYLQPLNLDLQPAQQQQEEMHFKFEAYDDYSPIDSDEQPDDEELLDYISSWQEQ